MACKSDGLAEAEMRTGPKEHGSKWARDESDEPQCVEESQHHIKLIDGELGPELHKHHTRLDRSVDANVLPDIHDQCEWRHKRIGERE